MVEAFFPLPSYIYVSLDGKQACARARARVVAHFRAIHANSNAFTWLDKIIRVFS